MTDLLAEQFLQHDSDDWMRKLRSAGVAAMIPKTQSNSQAFHRDPVNHSIGRIAQVQDPKGQFVRESALMVRVSGAATTPHRLAPEFDADTEAVLREHGHSTETITRLRQRGSIR